MEKYIKATAYKYGADVCGIGSIDRFEIEPRLIYSHFNMEVCTMLDHLTLELAKEMPFEHLWKNCKRL